MNIIKKITNKIHKSLEFTKQNLHEPVLGTHEKKYVNQCLDSGFVSTAGKMVVEFEDKIKKMEECGITIAKSPSKIGKTLFNKLSPIFHSIDL